ncbi:MAG: hypothetical protein MK219_02850 [Candidatus Poseidoniia archaeon]|nr:hypothetical protein [Candidatus Poseidoniia archaeon]
MASDRITFRFPIDKQFRADWDDFLRRTRDAGRTPSQMLQQLVIEYLDRQAHDEEADQQALLASEKRKPARKVRKVRRQPPEPVLKPELEDGVLRPADTPKFRMLALMRSLDDGEGVDPDMLLSEAERTGIPHPQLEMQKLVRRGILYIHEGLCRTAA